MPPWKSALEIGDPRDKQACRETSAGRGPTLENVKAPFSPHFFLPIEYALMNKTQLIPSKLPRYYYRRLNSTALTLQYGEHSHWYIIIPKSGSSTLRSTLPSVDARIRVPRVEADHPFEKASTNFAMFRHPLTRAFAAFRTISCRGAPWADRVTPIQAGGELRHDGLLAAQRVRRSFVDFIVWSWETALSDARYTLENNFVAADEVFTNYHHLTQMFFLSLYQPGEPSARAVTHIGRLEHYDDSILTYMARLGLTPPKGNKTRAVNADEGGFLRHALKKVPCSILWQLYAYYRQDFVCLGYHMPAICYRDACRPKWLHLAMASQRSTGE
jgi:hypothetical protein